MADEVGQKGGAEVSIVGEGKINPLPSSLQRHVYRTTGPSDFLNLEKALQG